MRSTLSEVLQAAAGLALLGLAAGVGTGDLATAVRSVPALWGAVLAPLVFTAPALLVIHRFLRLQAEPEQLFRALVRGLAGSSRLAVGLAPIVLFFSLLHASAALREHLFCLQRGLMSVAVVRWAGLTPPGGCA